MPNKDEQEKKLNPMDFAPVNQGLAPDLSSALKQADEAMAAQRSAENAAAAAGIEEYVKKVENRTSHYTPGLTESIRERTDLTPATYTVKAQENSSITPPVLESAKNETEEAARETKTESTNLKRQNKTFSRNNKSWANTEGTTGSKRNETDADGTYHWKGHTDEDGNWVSGLSEWTADNQTRIAAEIAAYNSNDGKTFLTEEEIQAHQQETANLYYDCKELEDYTKQVVEDLKAKYSTASDEEKASLDAQIKLHESNLGVYQEWQTTAKDIYDGWSSRNDYFDSMDDNKKKNVNDPAQYKFAGGDTPENIQKTIDNYNNAIRERQNFIDTNVGYVTDPMSEATIGKDIDKSRAEVREYELRVKVLERDLEKAEAHKHELEQQNADLELRRKYALITGQDETSGNSVIHAPQAADWKSISVGLNEQLSNAMKAGNEAEVASLTNEIRFVDQQFEDYTKYDLQQKYLATDPKTGKYLVSDEELDKAIARLSPDQTEKQGEKAGAPEKTSTVPVRTADDIRAEMAKLHPERDRDKYNSLMNELNNLGNPSETVAEVAPAEENQAEERELTEAEKWERDILLQEKERRDMEKLFKSEYVDKYKDQAALKWYEDATAAYDAAYEDFITTSSPERAAFGVFDPQLNYEIQQGQREAHAEATARLEQADKERTYAGIQYELSKLTDPNISADAAKGRALAPSITDLQTAFDTSVNPNLDPKGEKVKGVLAGLNITGEDADKLISMLGAIGVSSKDFIPRTAETTADEVASNAYALGETARDWTQSELDIYYSIWANEGAAAASKYAFEVNSLIGRGYHDQVLQNMVDIKTYEAEHRTGEFVTEALFAPWVTNPLNITALADFAATTSQVRRIGTAMTSPTSFTPSQLGDMVTTAHTSAIQETSKYPEIASLLYNSYNSAVGSVESAAIGSAIGSGLSTALGLGSEAVILGDTAAQAIARTYTQLSFFGSAAARSFDDFIKRGVDPGQAWGASLAAGLAEAFFEDFSFDKVYDAIKAGHVFDTFPAFAGNLLASSGIEMSEEVFTEIANFTTENLILKQDSSFWVAVNNYHDYSGMSYPEALKQALKDEGKEIGMAAASALISTMGSVGIPSSVSYSEFKKQTAQQAKALGERIVNGTETAKDLGKKLGEFYSTFTLVEAGQEDTLTKGQKKDLETLHGLAEKAKAGTATAEELGQLTLLAKHLDKSTYYAFVRDNKDAWNYISNGDASAAQIDYLASLIGEENVDKFIQASLENPDAFIADDFVAGLREATGVTTEEALKIENALGLVVAGTKTRSEAQIRKALNEAFKSDAAKTYALNYISDKVQQFNQPRNRRYTLASANAESAISPWLYTVNSETVTSDFEQTMVNVWSGVQRANETLNLAIQARALEQFNAKKSATSESAIRQARTQTDGIENFRDDSDMVRLNGKEYTRKDFLESIGKGINPITGESFKNGTPTQDQANIYFDNLLRNALTNDAFDNIVDASGTMKNYDAWQESLNTGDIENGRASVRVSENAGRNETAGQSRVGGPVAGSETGGVGTAQPVHTEGSGEAGGSAQEVKLATFDKNGEHDITIKGKITLDTAGMTEEEVEALDNLDSGLKVAITQAMAAGVDRIMIVNGSMTNSNGRVIDGFFGNTKVEGKRKYTIVVSSTGDQAGLTSTFRHELMHRLISGMNAKTKRAFLNTILETAFAGRSELYETIFDVYVKYAYGREYGAANIKDGILSLNKEIVEDIDEEMVCDLFGGIMTWARRSQDSAIGEFYREAYNRIERLVADTGLFDYVRSNWGKSDRNQKGTLDISEFKGTQANAFGKRWNGRKVEIPYSRTEISRLMSELRKDFRHMSDEEFAKFEQRVNGMETQPGTRQNQLYTAAAMEIIAEHERRAAESRTEEPTDTQTEETTEATEETAEATEETTEATEETEEVSEEKPAERLANNNMTAETDEDFDAIRNTLMKLKNKESFYFNYKDRQFVITVDESTDWGSVYKIALTNNGQLWIKVPIGDASSAQEAIDFIRARMDDTEETTQEATETELDKGQQYLNFLRTISEQSGEMNEDDFDVMFGSATDEILRGIVGREAADDFERRAIEAAQKEIDRRAAEDKAIAEQDSAQEEAVQEETTPAEEPVAEEKPAPKKRGRKKKEPAAENGIQTKENLRASEEKGRFVNKRKWTDKTTSPTDGDTITRTQFVERMTTTGWDELDDFGYPTHMTMAEAQDMFDEWLMEDRDGGGETMYSITADEAFDAIMPTPIEATETKFSIVDDLYNEYGVDIDTAEDSELESLYDQITKAYDEAKKEQADIQSTWNSNDYASLSADEYWARYHEWNEQSGIDAVKRRVDKLGSYNRAITKEKAWRAIDPEALIQKAKDIYGTTDDFRKSGYILPDGTMLDMSQGSNKRTLFHHETAQEVLFALKYPASDAIEKFVGRGGAIRIDVDSDGIDIPQSGMTPAQYETLRDFLSDFIATEDYDRAAFYVSTFGKNIGTSERFNPSNTTQILNAIRQYYDTGSFPKQSTTQQFYGRFSMVDTEAVTLDELQTARDEMLDLRQQLRDRKADVDEWSRRIMAGEAEIDDYNKWLSDSGYNRLYMQEREATRRYTDLNRAYDEQQERANAEAEQNAIEQSGLSEADYFGKEAVKVFGYTPYFYDAGYITPNGRMLNFSGEKGKHYGSRGQDHRSIGQIFAVTSGTEAMNRFINYGNIRIMAEAPGLDISADIEPTAEQYSRIRDFARSARDEDYFSIDITDEDGRVIDTIEYESVNPTKIVNDLKNYYRTGEVPQQSITEQFHSKYAILHDVVDENGRTYDNVVMVDKTLPSSIIDNNREFNKFVKANFAGLTLGTVDDYGIPETIQFASKRDRVRRNGNSRNAITELAYGRGRDRTVRLVYLNADEIVQTSTFWNYSEQNPNPNENHQGFDQNGWEYRRAYLLSGNTIYPVTLNIAQTDDGRSVLYFARVEKNKAVGVEYEATSRNNPGVDLNRAPEVLGSINTSTAESIIDEADEDVKSQDVDEEPLLDDYDTDVKYSIAVSDPDTLAFLNDQLESGEVTHTYKTFLEIVDEDGNVNLYPPMASMQKVEVQTKSGKTKTQKQMANAMHVGVWEESVGNPNSKNIIPDVYDKGPNKGEQKVDEHGNKKWQYRLQKEDPDLSDVNAAYDPYQHSSNVVLNDQFESAWKRPGLVTYECVIPNSELTSDYWYGVTDPDRARRADGEVITAALPVGMHEWHKGVIAGGLKNTDRQVYMTRWLMPIRRMDNSEVARMYKDILDAESEPISVPYNVVPPGLQEELEKIGVPINYEGTAGFQSLRGRYGEEDYPIGKRIAEESDTRFSALSIDPASTYDAFGDEVEVSNINPTVTQSMLSDQLFYSEDGNTAYYQLDTGETVVLDNVGEDSPEARYINYLEAMNNANSSNNTTAQPYTIPPATRNASDGYNLGESNDGLRRGTEEVPAPDQEGALRRTGSTTERNGQSEPQSEETEGVDSKFAVSVSEVFENDKGDPDRNIYDEDGNLITTASTYPLGSDELFFFDAMERGDFSDMEKLVQEYRDKGYTVSESTFDLLSRMVEQNDNMTPEQQEAMQRAVDEARAKYGTLRGNDVGKVESTIPARTNADTKTRRHVGTVAINTNQAMNDALTNETMVNEILGYTPQSNPETLEKARALLRSQYDGDIDKAINHIADLVNSGTMPTAADVALAEIVITELANDASDPLRLNKAVKVTADLAVLGTNLGQAVQAMSLIRKLTPRGQMYYLNGVVKQLNRQYATQIRNGKMQPVRINDALLAQLFAATNRDEINTAIEAIKDNLAEQIPVTLWDRWNAWRYLAMLGNPRTHIRNLLGNAAFAPAVFMKDMILRQLQQNTKWVDPSARTMGKADLSGWLNKKGSSNPYVDYAIKDFGLMSDVAKGKKVGNKYADINDILSRRKMFPLEGLNWLNERNSELLEGEDLAFIQRYYVRYMAEFLQARGIKAEDLNTFSTTPEGKALLNQARSWSMQQAHRDTYHEMNTWAMALNKLKHNGRLSYTLMEGVLPFVGTPANILKLAAVNYSPYGLIRSGIQLKQSLDRGDKQSTVQILDGIASGLTGTGIMVLGALLARFGLFGFKLRGAGPDDDDEAQFERLMGHQQWAIEGHGISYTLDWAAPMSLPLFTGATFWELFSREHPFASPDELWAGLMGLANPMLSMSMLDGLENTLSSLTYATSGSRISALMGAALTSHLAQAFPTFFGQVNRIIDPVRRTTYTDKNDWMPGALQKFIQQNVYSKVLGLSTRKIAYVDEWGRIDTDENLLSRIFSNFISPGYLSFINETPVDTELRRLYDALGDTEGQKVLPNWAEKSVGKQDIGKDDEGNVITIDGKDFTAKEYEKYAQIVGQTRYAMLSEIFSTEEYLSATDTEKAKMVSDAYDYARSLGRKALIPERNMDASWMETAKKVGAVDYIVMRQEYEDNKNNDRIYGWLADNPNLSTDQMAALLTDKFTTPEYIASNEITGYRYKTLNSDDEMLSAMYEVALQNGLSDLYKDQTYINASSDERADMFRVRVEEIKSQTISDYGDYLGTTNRALSIGKSSSLNQDTKFEVMLDAYDGDYRAQAAWIAESYKPDKLMVNPDHPGYQLEIPEEARKKSGWMYENVMSRYQDAYEALWTGDSALSKKFQDANARNDKTAMARIAERVYKETVAMVEEEYAAGLAKSGNAVELFMDKPTGYDAIDAYDIAVERYGDDLDAIGRYVAQTMDNHTTLEDPDRPGFYLVLDEADQIQGKKDREKMFTEVFAVEASKDYFKNATREQKEEYLKGIVHAVDAEYQTQYARKIKEAGYDEATTKLNNANVSEFLAHMENANYSREEAIDIMVARYKSDHLLYHVNYNPAARVLQIEAAKQYYEDHYDEVASGAMTWAKYRDNASKAANKAVTGTYNVKSVGKAPAPDYITPTIDSEFASDTATVTPPPAATSYVIPPAEVTRSRSDGAPSWEEMLELNENPDRYNVGDQTTSIADNYNPNGPVYHFEDYIPAMTEEEAREEANWQTTTQNVQIFPDEVGENSIAHDIATEYYFAYLNNPDYAGQTYEDWLNNHRDFTMTPAGGRTYSGTGQKAERRGAGLNNGGMPYGSSANSVGGASQNFWNRLIRR